MQEWQAGVLIGCVAGLLGGLSVLLFVLLRPRPKCPDCGEPLPRFRKPANLRQTLWGGCTCLECGCEVGPWGGKVQQTRNRKRDLS